MKLQRLLLLIFVIATSSFVSVAQLYTFKNFNYEEGLNLISILTVEESDDGYLWFGTDGAGLIRYDGQAFDYLEDIQGRNNRHVNDIFFHENRILFSTLYRGVFSLENNSINRLSYIARLGKCHAIFQHNNIQIVLQNSGLRTFKDSSLVREKLFSPVIPDLQYYGSCRLDEKLLIFTSDLNYCVKEGGIQEMHDWFGVSKDQLKDFVVGYEATDSLFLIDKYLTKILSVPLKKGATVNLDITNISEPLLLAGEEIVKWDKRKEIIAFITNKGRIVTYDINTSQFHLIENNSKLQIVKPTNILIDRNNDIWVTTSSSGAYRVSLEPFTKLSSNKLFAQPEISFIGKTLNNDFIITVNGKGTFIGKGPVETDFVENADIYLTSKDYIGDTLLVSTNKGVYQIRDKKLELYPPLNFLKEERVSLIKNAFGYLWFSVISQGLFRKDLISGKVDSFTTAPAYYYNGIINKDSTALYFGTNFGVMKYDHAKEQLLPVQSKVNGKTMGAYVGNSIMDSYGTIWFSFDEGLMGITAEKKFVAITEEQFLPSLLIYTLNSDKFGHLIIGSNKGITVINVDKNGKALSSKTYNKESGFYGHETHMRSSFQSADGSILLGTLGGAVLVRPEYLDRRSRLSKPIIHSLKNKNIENLIDNKNPVTINTEDNNLLIEFESVNTKSTFVTYSYKLEGADEEEWINWSNWSPKQEAIFNNLKAGSYILKVKSSIDGANESEESTISFDVIIPFYKNKWFIIGVISIIVLINISFLDSTKNFNRENIIISRDVVANKSTAKSLLAFGAVANTLGHLFAPRVDDSLQLHDFSAIVTGALLMMLFLVVTFVKSSSRKAGTYLVIGFLILLAYNLMFTYISDIHPFYFTSALLVTFVAPYTLRRLRSAVVVSLAMGAASVAIIFLVEDAKFNQYLFLMGIAIACFLMIFKTYMRNNSLEQLIFASGIVNKGNALVVAFDKNGKISFVSENMESLLGVDETLKGESILLLNEYQPSYNEMHNFSDDHLISEFKEGAIFVTPLITEKDEVVYYQWSCKKFSEELRIILGQDVTEKINLENYYELIVKNADDLIFQTDTNGNFTFVNEKCCEVFERSKSELLDLSILNVVEPAYQKRVRYFIDATLKERQKGKYKEFPILTPNGETKWLGQNLSTMTTPGAENVVKGFLGLARDITSKKKANSLIKEQNKAIMDSINYARRIQFNMLPRSSEFADSFDEHFILYRPKDIVSGDFFWLKEIGDKTILILSDCTGHGVPGSFMTLLGINILKQIVEEAKIIDPGEILNQLDEHLSELLPRDGQNRIQDGMEVVVCSFDKNSEKVEYALAGGRFLIKDNKEGTMKVVKGQIKHIGDEPVINDFIYDTESVTLNENQILYLFTDGFPDQFGGTKNKKITIKKFLALIDAISYQPMNEQNSILQEYHKEWMGDFEQTDDMTVIGVRGRK
jgi:PAS domain S-box-containing protein